jgi:hypothetical protein
MVSGLQVMMRSGVMVQGGKVVMLDGCVFLRFWHGRVLLERFGEKGYIARKFGLHSAR